MAYYGNDYSYQGERHWPANRGYDADQRFLENDRGQWGARTFNDSPRDFYRGQGNTRYGQDYGWGTPSQPWEGNWRQSYDRDFGYRGARPSFGRFNQGYGQDYGYGYRGHQRGGWEDMYRWMNRPRSHGMVSPWESHVPGAGPFAGQYFGPNHGGGFM
jgi:hypothetical protein